MDESFQIPMAGSAIFWIRSPLWRNGSRLSVFRGQFDELEYNDWKFEQGNYALSSNRSNIMSDLSRSVHNIMSDARNQPEFSYFS